MGGFASLVPIASAYTLPLTEHVTPMPPWFTHEALRLPEGTRVLAIPYATPTMTYQAEDSLRFDLEGGYVLVPGKGGASIWRQPLTGTPAILARLSVPAVSQPRISSTETTRFRTSLRQWGVQVTVITPSIRLSYAVKYLTAVYGRRPVEQRGAAVWYGKIPRHET